MGVLDGWLGTCFRLSVVGAELETGTEVTERVQRVLGTLASVLQSQGHGSELCWHLRSGQYHFVHSEPGPS